MESDTEVRPRKKLRSFTAETKARLLAEYDAAATPLERAALMRREGVYSPLLSNWRKLKLARFRGHLPLSGEGVPYGQKSLLPAGVPAEDR